MLACWVEDPYGDYFKKRLARLSDYIRIGEDGMKKQVRLKQLDQFASEINVDMKS